MFFIYVFLCDLVLCHIWIPLDLVWTLGLQVDLRISIFFTHPNVPLVDLGWQGHDLLF